MVIDPSVREDTPKLGRDEIRAMLANILFALSEHDEYYQRKEAYMTCADAEEVPLWEM